MVFELFGITVNLKKEVIIAGAAALLLLGSITGYLIVRDDSDIIVETSDEKTAVKETESGVRTEKAADTRETTAGKEIRIYVTGCVNSPGIVSLTKGQLIDDAIRLAGGVTAEADLEGINLVYELKENLMLHIRSKKEEESDGAETAGEAGRGVKVVKESGGAVISGNGSGSGNSSGTLVNINTAGPEELDKLPGIGEATARDIIAYRESNGPFKTVQDIMKVPRIKESRFANIKDFITVD